MLARGQSFKWQMVSAGLIASAAIFAFVALFAKESFDSRAQALAEASDAAETLSRFVEDHAYRTVQSVEAALSRVADRHDPRLDPASAGLELQHQLSTSALMRQIAVLDGSLKVVASSDPRSVGRNVDLAATIAAARARPGVLHVGPLQRGRYLAAVTDPADLRPHRYIPVIYAAARTSAGSAPVFVAAVNPEYFTAFYDSILVGKTGEIRLLSYDGRLLAMSGDAPTASQSFADRPPFKGFLPHRESGRFEEAVAGDQLISAFRVTRQYPLVVAVGLSRAATLMAWQSRALPVALSLAVLSLLILGSAGFWMRQLRERERQRRRLAESEQASRQVQARLLDAIDNMSEGFALFDSADNLAVWNEQYVTCFPYLQPHLQRGLPFRDLVEIASEHARLPDHEVGSWKAWRLAKHADPGSPFEQLLADGRSLQTVERRTSEGGTVLVVRDITTERAALLDLQHARHEADKASQAKSEFVALVSHEIRTPMNAVIGFTGLLLDSPLNNQQLEYARGINESANRLLLLINDVLDFSQLDAGKLALEIGPMDLHGLLVEVTNTCRILIGTKPITARTDIGADVPRWVEGDSGRLYQVLLNLLGNAAKFTRLGAIICRATVVTRGPQSVRVRLEVVDTGPGIPRSQMKHLFEPFERGTGADTALAVGTGLGLAISQRFVHLMGGRIGLESVEGRGTCAFVELELPLAAEPASSDPRPKTALGTDLQKQRILVAEDTPASQMVIRALLEKRGHRVQMVANGAEAVEAARAGAFDLIFLDLQMPVMGGIEAAARIRTMPAFASVPIVALTAQAQPKIREQALAVGVNEYLVKPVRPSALDAILEKFAAERADRPTPALSASDDAGRERDIDWTMLDDLREAVGDAAARKLAERFVADVRGIMADLPEGQGSENAARLKASAHKLAGLLSQFGAVAAATIAREIEDTAAPGIDLRDLVAHLRSAVEDNLTTLSRGRNA